MTILSFLPIPAVRALILVYYYNTCFRFSGSFILLRFSLGRISHTLACNKRALAWFFAERKVLFFQQRLRRIIVILFANLRARVCRSFYIHAIAMWKCYFRRWGTRSENTNVYLRFLGCRLLNAVAFGSQCAQNFQLWQNVIVLTF